MRGNRERGRLAARRTVSVKALEDDHVGHAQSVGSYSGAMHAHEQLVNRLATHDGATGVCLASTESF